MSVKKYSDEDIADIKERFLDGLWEYKVIKKDGVISGKVVCTNDWFRKYLAGQKVASKYRSISNDSFFAQASLITLQLVLRFKPNNKQFNWDGLLTKDERSLSQIFSYIISVFPTKMNEFNNLINNVSEEIKSKSNNGKEHVYRNFYVPDISSSDVPVGTGETKETFINIRKEEDNLYSQHKGYYEMPFLTWFRENRYTLLTKNQNDVFDILVNITRADGGNISKETYQEAGITAATANRNKYNIKKKIEEEWAKVEDQLYVGFNTTKKKADMELLQEFLDLVDIEQATEDDYRLILTKWVAATIRKSRMFADLVYLNLKGEHTKHVVKGMFKESVLIPNATLIEILKLVKLKLTELNGWETSNVIPFGWHGIQKEKSVKKAEKVKKQNAKAENFEKPKSKWFQILPTGIAIEQSFGNDKELGIMDQTKMEIKKENGK